MKSAFSRAYMEPKKKSRVCLKMEKTNGKTFQNFSGDRALIVGVHNKTKQKNSLNPN